MFFVLIALTSDMICFLFIPVHWLFFAASTYVWVQYVWHTDRGICLPTVSLWLLFVYIEASVRLKDLKSFSSTSVSSSPNLDLCRPFAAHCIGYPVVTLGFGVKSYLSYRMRLRKQKEVAKENDFYMELVQSALPEEVIQEQKQLLQQQLALQHNSVIPSTVEANGQVNGSVVMNGHLNQQSNHHQLTSISSTTSSSKNKLNGSADQKSSPKENNQHDHSNHQKYHLANQKEASSKSNLEYDAKPRSSTNSSSCSSESRSNSINNHSQALNHQKQGQSQELDFEEDFLQQHLMSAAKSKLSSSFNNSISNGFSNKVLHDNPSSFAKLTNEACVASSAPNSLSTSCSSTPSKWNSTPAANVLSTSSTSSSSNKKNKNQEKNHVVNNNLKENNQEPVSLGNKEDKNHQTRLESDIKRLKADLQASRQTEQDLRSQISSLVNKKSHDQEKLRSEVEQLQQDNETMQSKLHNLVTSRQQDKANISMLEKKLQEEKKSKTSLESQLNSEREANKKKQQKQDQEVKKDCSSDQCKNQRRDLENDLKQTKRELKMREDQVKHMEREAASLRQYKDSHSETEVLMSALSAMQDKNAHLEISLSAETRLKLDLFSALGDTKRQLEICQALMAKKDKEIDELKSKIAEVMACMPTSLSSSNIFSPSTSSLDTNSLVSSLLFNSKFLSSHHDSLGSPSSNLTTTSNGSSNGSSSSPFSNLE